MTIEYDEKGKIFTDVIRKTPVVVTVQTRSHLIEGLVHVRPGTRLKDELDRDELFIAMTDVKILRDDGRLLRKVPFLAVARAQIVWIYPEEDDAK